MPHDEFDKETVIPVDLIRETIMPPYEYQKPQNGFGSITFEQSPTLGQEAEKQDDNQES